MTLAAENLFLRKQLAMYQERQVKPRRATDATRLTLVWLSRVGSTGGLPCAIVQPETFTRWHRQGFRPVLALEIQARVDHRFLRTCKR